MVQELQENGGRSERRCHHYPNHDHSELLSKAALVVVPLGPQLVCQKPILCEQHKNGISRAIISDRTLIYESGA